MAPPAPALLPSFSSRDGQGSGGNVERRHVARAGAGTVMVLALDPSSRLHPHPGS